MTRRPATGLYARTPRSEVVDALQARAGRRLERVPDATLDALLEDALFHERQRLERQAPGPGETERLDALARALVRGGRDDRLAAACGLVHAWADEIHGRFSIPTYRVATTVFPPALAFLLGGRTADGPRFAPEHRVKIEGDTELLQQLAEESTLVLAPTHVSNLDSPMIGLALALAGLPPFLYGAGLNLFSNPILGWWMDRLGAYTVDRTKKAELYKEVLKDYSVYQLTRRHHSLFFPGGTRSRSGAIETRVKKGLLGTGVLAWQEMLAQGRPDPDIVVVPMTLSFTLVLEAATLIADHLEEAGKQRYIITDDEFAQPQRVASFVSRVLSLDASVVCRFGDPVDPLGRPVPRDARERAGASRERRGYVTGADGQVEWDPQRDRVYTDMLGRSLVDAWPQHATILPTHLVAWVAWHQLSQEVAATDPFRLVRTPPDRRRLPIEPFLAELGRARARVLAGADARRWHAELPGDASSTLDRALDAFGRYHRTRAVVRRGGAVVIEDPELCLYYRNRAVFALSPDEEAP